MDITRKQFTNSASGKELGKGPMNTFSNVPEYPPSEFQGSGAAEPRYALLHRVARSHQGAADCIGARYGGPLLPVADARHVDGCVRVEL